MLSGHRKCHFSSPELWHFCQKCHISSDEKWHFQWPNGNSETTFISPTSPKNDGFHLKINIFLIFCWVPGRFSFFCLFQLFGCRFQKVKNLKSKSPILEMKMRSNQKVEENKPALKFNFTQEYMHPDIKLINIWGNQLSH